MKQYMYFISYMVAEMSGGWRFGNAVVTLNSPIVNAENLKFTEKALLDDCGNEMTGLRIMFYQLMQEIEQDNKESEDIWGLQLTQ